MIRPFYRSRLFWLGVPGLVFFVWLWVDSTRFVTEMVRMQGRWELYVLSYQGEGYLTVTRRTGASTGSSYVRVKETRGISWFPPISEIVLLRVEADPFDPLGGERKSWNVRLPMWTLTALYGCGWAGSLVWWQLRKARLKKLHAASHE